MSQATVTLTSYLITAIQIYYQLPVLEFESRPRLEYRLIHNEIRKIIRHTVCLYVQRKTLSNAEYEGPDYYQIYERIVAKLTHFHYHTHMSLFDETLSRDPSARVVLSSITMSSSEGAVRFLYCTVKYSFITA